MTKNESGDRPGDRPGTAFAADLDLLPDVVRGVLQRRGETDWSVRQGDFWCSVSPGEGSRREQGWKLHVAATPLSATLVLAAAARVLVAERATFKFAGTLDRVRSLTNARVRRGGGGKFLTVYPDDDQHFLRLAERLHQETEGLPGPGILSDRRYRPNSLVHYRYGAFLGVPTLTRDGTVEPMLRAPDGTPEPDRREAWVTTPSWATSALPEPETAPRPARKPGQKPTAVLLNDRYVVRKAIRHAYRGGVYRAEDQHTGAEVVIKEARPHVGGELDGSDEQGALRHEAQVMETLRPLGVTPAAVETFTQGGNLFLVQELVPGLTLRDWAAERRRRELSETVDVALALVETVALLHGQDQVIRDLSPNNVMVRPDGGVRLIDVESVRHRTEPAVRRYTPGYAAPEVTDATERMTTMDPEADLYGLGMVLLHLATGVDTVLLTDLPRDRTADERIHALVDLALAEHPEAAPLRPLLLGLTVADPAARWSLERTRAHLTALAPATGGTASTTGATTGATATADGPAPLAGEALDRLTRDAVEHLIRTHGTGDKPHLWPQEGFAATNDPLNVQHGAGGTLGALVRAATVLPEHRKLRETVTETADWIARRLTPEEECLPPGSPTLPGLYFGRSGTAWALLDAARLLDDDTLADTAARLARAVPTDWPNRDICHGASGAGMTQLAFWRTTGEPDFLQRALDTAEAIVAVTEEHPAGVIWPIPADFDSALAGNRSYGFAHGTAGVGALLLAAAEAGDREDLLDRARAAGDTLVRLAQVDGDQATWPGGDRAADGAAQAVHWCDGASGIGTFLVRLWRTTGHAPYRELAELAARAVRRTAWRSAPVACHGLTGQMDFLLDMAAALGEDHYRRSAGELAAHAHSRAVLRDGLLVLPDETLGAVTACYGTGLAGALTSLVRLGHGGTRMWMPDDLALTAPEGHREHDPGDGRQDTPADGRQADLAGSGAA
ncbi:class IV lanthionine synthetase LanL [Streptomyces sp. NPDC005438]|uniref:class IV lanthionine synthetase LanL n=1 Tax=Streptomyces sp. NPDC005438 TaxID=3156880 RepID=UPI0033BF891A